MALPRQRRKLSLYVIPAYPLFPANMPGRGKGERLEVAMIPLTRLLFGIHRRCTMCNFQHIHIHLHVSHWSGNAVSDRVTGRN